MRELIVWQAATIVIAVAVVLLTVCVGKSIRDRRTLRDRRVDDALKDAVVEFVDDDGANPEQLIKAIGRTRSRARDVRLAHAADLLVSTTSELGGEVIDAMSKTLVALGYADLLRRNASSSGERIRAHAARRFGEIVDGADIPALERLLHDRSQAVRICAARSLGKVGDTASGRRLLQSAAPPAVIADALLNLRERALPAVHAGLRSDNPTVRRISLDVIGERRTPDDRRRVAAALRDDDRHVRVAAAVALGKIGFIDTCDELVVATTDLDAPTRRAAFEALIAIEPPDIVDALTDGMADPDHLVARTAACGFLAFGEHGERWLTTIAETTPETAPVAHDALAEAHFRRLVVRRRND